MAQFAVNLNSTSNQSFENVETSTFAAHQSPQNTNARAAVCLVVNGTSGRSIASIDCAREIVRARDMERELERVRNENWITRWASVCHSMRMTTGHAHLGG